MRALQYIYVLILTGLFIPFASAQNKEGQLTSVIKTEVIERLSSALRENYVFADTGRRMGDFINKQMNKGAYAGITSPVAFANSLTADVQQVYKDLHLLITYNPGTEKSQSYIESVTKQIRQDKQQNYGVYKADVLSGNIGYIEIGRFFDLNEQSKETISSVFTFLKNTDALIIDLRNNLGGDAWMVNYISSYFFNEKTHINDMYDRRANQVYEYWTQPIENAVPFSTIPVYILVNAHTFSGAEGFAYGLQTLHRAVVIGEVTAGGAHPVSPVNITNGFTAYIPFARAISPVTKTNWEGKGVEPDLKTANDSALDIARLSFYAMQVNTSKDTGVVKSNQMMQDILNSKRHRFFVAPHILRKYSGNYNGSSIAFENGDLFFTPSDGHRVKLNAISQTVFSFNNWELEFINDEKGKVSAIRLMPLSRVSQTIARNR